MRRLIVLCAVGAGALWGQFTRSQSGSSINATEIDSKPQVRGGAGAGTGACTPAGASISGDLWITTAASGGAAVGDVWACTASGVWTKIGSGGYAVLTGLATCNFVGYNAGTPGWTCPTLPANGSLWKSNVNQLPIAAVPGTDFENPLAFVAPLSRSTNTISCILATGSVDGCLSHTDWSTFNGKEPSIAGGTIDQVWNGTKAWTSLVNCVAAGGVLQYATSTHTTLCHTLAAGDMPDLSGTYATKTAGGDLSGSLPAPAVATVLSGHTPATIDTAQTLSLKTLPSPSLGAGSSPVTETWTVGAGGVTANTLVQTDSSAPLKIVAATAGAYGVAMSTISAAGSVEVARFGTVSCVTDTGGATAGDLVILGTGSVIDCKDSGQTASSAISSSVRIIGVFRSSAAAGSTALVELTPAHFGTQVSGGVGLVACAQNPYTTSGAKTCTHNLGLTTPFVAAIWCFDPDFTAVGGPIGSSLAANSLQFTLTNTPAAMNCYVTSGGMGPAGPTGPAGPASPVPMVLSFSGGGQPITGNGYTCRSVDRAGTLIGGQIIAATGGLSTQPAPVADTVTISLYYSASAAAWNALTAPTAMKGSGADPALSSAAAAAVSATGYATTAVVKDAQICGWLQNPGGVATLYAVTLYFQ